MALHIAARLSPGSPTRRPELGAKLVLAAAAPDHAQPDTEHSDQQVKLLKGYLSIVFTHPQICEYGEKVFLQRKRRACMQTHTPKNTYHTV